MTGGRVDGSAVDGRPGRALASDRRAWSRPRWILLVVVVAAVGLAAAWSLARPAPSAEVLIGAEGLAYSSRALTARAGEVEVTFANTDAVTHTFTISSLGVDLVVESGGAATATFEAEPGRYNFFCAIAGHDTPEMRGVLEVR